MAGTAKDVPAGGCGIGLWPQRLCPWIICVLPMAKIAKQRIMLS